jgi:hypothetical protein
MATQKLFCVRRSSVTAICWHHWKKNKHTETCTCATRAMIL